MNVSTLFLGTGIFLLQSCFKHTDTCCLYIDQSSKQCMHCLSSRDFHYLIANVQYLFCCKFCQSLLDVIHANIYIVPLILKIDLTLMFSFSFCVCVCLSVCLCVYAPHMCRYLMNPQEGIESSVVCCSYKQLWSVLCRFWELESELPEEKHMLLTAEPSLQSLNCVLQ